MNSRSWPTRTGGSGGSNGSNYRTNGDDDEAWLDVETFVSTLASFGEPKEQLAAYLKSKDAEVSDLKQKLKASCERTYTKQHLRSR